MGTTLDAICASNTPFSRLVAADYLEDSGLRDLADELRDLGTSTVGEFPYGDGYGDGNGYGNGYGYGNGDGYGDGNGYGNGYGYGDGDGDGYGDGYGYGYGYGNGDIGSRQWC